MQKSGSGWEPVKNIFAECEYKAGNYSQEFSIPNVEDGECVLPFFFYLPTDTLLSNVRL